MSERSERPMTHGSVALRAADGQGKAATHGARRARHSSARHSSARNGARR
ncbi:hypothetical protein ACGFIE_22015 [Micromonospora sp. NPDC049275]